MTELSKQREQEIRDALAKSPRLNPAARLLLAEVDHLRAHLLESQKARDENYRQWTRAALERDELQSKLRIATEALERVEPRMEQVAKTLKQSQTPHGSQEHDGILIAIGFVRAEIAPVLAKLKGDVTLNPASDTTRDTTACDRPDTQESGDGIRVSYLPEPYDSFQFAIEFQNTVRFALGSAEFDALMNHMRRAWVDYLRQNPTSQCLHDERHGCPNCFDDPATTPSIEKLIDRFLVWPLPKSVCSDRCVLDHGREGRTGTNLLTATEARQILEYLLMPAIAEKDSKV